MHFFADAVKIICYFSFFVERTRPLSRMGCDVVGHGLGYDVAPDDVHVVEFAILKFLLRSSENRDVRSMNIDPQPPVRRRTILLKLLNILGHVDFAIVQGTPPSRQNWHVLVGLEILVRQWPACLVDHIAQ